jgi:hypothetical protein
MIKLPVMCNTSGQWIFSVSVSDKQAGYDPIRIRNAGLFTISEARQYASSLEATHVFYPDMLDNSKGRHMQWIC